MAVTERVRLHITPFNQELFDRYIPPTLKPQASNISFHTIETFPERGFGYIELPPMEAQKLKTKLNGSTLKGSKVKIEEAKLEKKKRKSAELVEDEEKQVTKKLKRAKQKKEDGVIPGHELPEGRHVKRGWVDNATKKSKKSKEGLEGKKMRFKTEVPANKVTIDEKEKKSKDKEKKEKREKKEKKSGKKAVVVKEFSETSKPSTTAALRGRRAAVYEDGKGWVDAEGNVVEEELESIRRTRSSKKMVEVATRPKSNQEPESEVLSDSMSSEDEDSSSSKGDSSTVLEPSPSDNEADLDRQLSEAKSNTATNAAVELETQESTLVGDPSPSFEHSPLEVHPLEALFKRPAPTQISPGKPKRPTPIDTSFSFFTADGDAIDDATIEAQPPQTPHTKQDLEWRSIRSAAPTPDTAAIGKRFNFTFEADEDEEEEEDEDKDEDEGEDEDVDVDVRMADVVDGGAGPKEESEFRKWFYENRGDLNRAWKKRRREERKVVRQRENRRLSRRIA